MQKLDYYKILGVDKNASQEDIKSAYKEMAKKNHPDKFTDTSKKETAESEFKKISEAYAVLSDPRKRHEYDNPTMRRGMNFGGRGFSHNFNVFFESDPLEMIVGISVNESHNGTSKRIRYKRKTMCTGCMGTGSGSETMSVNCPGCHGSGTINLGMISIPCNNCGGMGKRIRQGCNSCSASGVMSVDAEVEVNVPKGFVHGNVMKFAGMGNYSRFSKSSGDLYVRIAVKDDDMYRVKYPDIIVDVPIDFKTATLGGEAVVPSPHGKIKLTIPAGTSHGTHLRVPGKGLSVSAGRGYGSLIAMIIIDIPKVAKGGEGVFELLDSDLITNEKVAEFIKKIDSL
jgi:molecular chaperone DnaJ